MMTRRTQAIAMVVLAFVVIVLLGNRLGRDEGQAKPVAGTGFAAVPGLKGGQDIFGPYEPVRNWPTPMSESLPNHETWRSSFE